MTHRHLAALQAENKRLALSDVGHLEQADHWKREHDVLKIANEEWYSRWEQCERENERLKKLVKVYQVVIDKTHANGYGHLNPFEACPAPSCTMARKLSENT